MAIWRIPKLCSFCIPDVVGAPPFIFAKKYAHDDPYVEDYFLSDIWTNNQYIFPIDENKHLCSNQLHSIHELLFCIFENGRLMSAHGISSKIFNLTYGDCCQLCYAWIAMFMDF
jgi:hypothetical protein